MEGDRLRVIEIVTMGCAWTLDVSDLDPALADEMAERWQRGAELFAAVSTPRLDEEPTVIRVINGPAPSDRAEGELCVTATEADRLPYALSREITRAGLTRLRGRATLLHAAALADDMGRTLVLVAPSGGGKSTASRVLGTRLGYVSDESVILLEDGRIAPHPKPPSLVIDPQDRWHKEEPSPDAIGLGPTPPEPRLGALLTLNRDESLTAPMIEEVGLIDQMLAVIPETSSTWWLDDGLDRLARAVTSGGPPACLRYAEIDTCHDLVREHLAAAAPTPPTWEHLPPDHEQRRPSSDVGHPQDQAPVLDDTEALADTDLFVRGTWSDAIAVEGEVLVLAGPRPFRLAGPGAVIWRAAQSPISLDDLTTQVTEEFGDNPDGAAIVREAVAQLVGHRVLRRV